VCSNFKFIPPPLLVAISSSMLLTHAAPAGHSPCKKVRNVRASAQRSTMHAYRYMYYTGCCGRLSPSDFDDGWFSLIIAGQHFSIVRAFYVTSETNLAALDHTCLCVQLKSCQQPQSLAGAKQEQAYCLGGRIASGRGSADAWHVATGILICCPSSFGSCYPVKTRTVVVTVVRCSLAA